MNLLKNISYSNIFTASCGLILFLLCVYPRLVSISTILLGVVVAVGYAKKKIHFHWNNTGIILLTLYLTYVVGTFYTDFPQLAFKLLERKLSFIVFPLLLMIQFKTTVSYRNIFAGLLLGCGVAMTIGLVKFYCPFMNNDLPPHAITISAIVHPGYFSTYITIAVIYLWTIYYKKRNNLYFLMLCFIITLISMFYILYTYSLAGILFMLLIIAFTCIYFVYVKWKMLGISIFTTLFTCILFVFYQTSSILKKQIDLTNDAIEEYVNISNDYSKLQYPYSSSMIRLILWQMSWEQIKNVPLGVGTGNVDHAIQQRMEGRVDPLFIEQNLNPHNQYLHIGVELGVIGLGIFIVLLIHIFVYAIRHKKLLLLAIVCSLAFNCLFESMLQKQSGIVFYTLMFCLLTIPISYEKK